MGDWKEMQQSASYTNPDEYACPACVTDPYLAGILAANLEDEPCSYCGSAKAAPIYVICDEISATIAAYYTDPVNVLPYDGGEGGYQGLTFYTSELVADEFGDWTECEELLDHVVTAFEGDDSEWCERDGSNALEALLYSWSDFSEQIKHRTRYLFLQRLDRSKDRSRENQGQIPPRKMLNALRDLFKEFDLFYELPQATNLFRVRVIRDGSHPTTAAGLGAPLPKDAIFPNRMSPAGIPMFYAALDKVTAVLETCNPEKDKDQETAIACFHNKRPLALLDLTKLPPVPSMFDLRKRTEHPRLAFLRSFESDFTKPVDRDTESHTEYVPTQVVTEFVRHRLRTAANKPVDGILYRSSRSGMSPAVVIFAGPKDCGPRNRDHFDPEPFLDLINVQYVDLAEFKMAHGLPAQSPPKARL
jgi:hypothetical protein